MYVVTAVSRKKRKLCFGQIMSHILMPINDENLHGLFLPLRVKEATKLRAMIIRSFRNPPARSD